MRRFGLGLLICVLVIVAVPASAGAVVVQSVNGQRYGVFLRPGVGVSALRSAQVPTAPRSALASGNVDYNGGPVVHSSAPYLIFWAPPSGSGVAAHSKTVLEQYLSDTAADSGKATDVYSVLRQYTDSTGFADYSQTFSTGQAIVDTHAYPSPIAAGCTTAAGFPNCITDDQIHTELTRLISADSLPSGIGPNAPIYFVITPADTNVCMPGSVCASNAFCAYHSSFTDGSNPVLYSSVPFIVWTLNSTKGCQTDGTQVYQTPNNDQADNIADDLSHELSETITDPLGTAWWNTTGGNEVADNCEEEGPNGPLNGQSLNAYLPTLGGSEPAGTLYDQAINGDHYYTQTDWSNGDVGCRTQTSADTLWRTSPTRSTTQTPWSASTPRRSANSTGSITSVSWNFGDGSTAFSPSAPALINHTYASPGTYTVTLTLVDSFGNLSTVSHSVVADELPTASFTGPTSALAGTAVTFDGSGSSDPDGSITGYSWSFGDGTTSTAGPTTSHTYAAPGTYTVTLSVTDSSGLQSTAVSKQITVDELPTAAFTGPTSATAGTAVTVDGSGSSDPDGSITGYSWSFGDGTTSTAGPTTSHTYAAPGTYTVTLKVTDSRGLQSSAVSHQVVVGAASPTPSLGKVKISGNTAAVTVKCNGAGAATCRVTVELTVTETRSRGTVIAVAATAKTSKKTVVVGKVTATFSGGQTATIHIGLNRTGRQLLAKFHKLRATLTLLSAGKTVARTQITFKAKGTKTK